MTDIKQVLLLWCTKFWIKFGSAIKSETMSTNSHKLIISKVEKKNILSLTTTFGVLI